MYGRTYYPKYIKILVCRLENQLPGINMVRTETPICDFNQAAIDFKLKGVDGNYYSLDSLKGKNGLLDNVYLQSLPLC